MNTEHENYRAGERIVTKGDPAGKAYMIQSGKVRVFLEDGEKRVDLAVLGEGSIFGETAIFEGEFYGANVEALEDSALYVITPESLASMLKGSDPIVRALIRMLIERLRTTNEALLKSETREFMDIAFI
ncbi:MAG: cyclic nucleotide-binding domain-containing protein [Alphaproteobacteria bacterium]|nr:cyclic nucleotide-binding domain-containing protein [Alphaproteobacteria bacterium]